MQSPREEDNPTSYHSKPNLSIKVKFWAQLLDTQMLICLEETKNPSKQANYCHNRKHYASVKITRKQINQSTNQPTIEHIRNGRLTGLDLL